jgi:hypothetical protein
MTEGIEPNERYSYMTWGYTKGTYTGKQLIDRIKEKNDVMSWMLIEGDK